MKTPAHIGLRELAERILNHSYSKSLEDFPGTVLYVPDSTHELQVQKIHGALARLVQQAEKEGQTEIVIEGFPTKIYVGKPAAQGSTG